jgi:transcription termination factor Rho
MVPAGARIDEMIFEEKKGKKKLTPEQADKITG